MRESKSLLKLLQMDLEAHPPTAPTLAARALAQTGASAHSPNRHLSPSHARARQTRTDAGPHPRHRRRKQRRHPRTSQHPSPSSFPSRTWPPNPNPQSPIPGRQAFRYFRPPLPAIVSLDGNRPLRITAPGIHGKVLNAAGPWRTSGDWWTTTIWNRDEWDIALSNGALYRIYRDSQWFIEGSYD